MCVLPKNRLITCIVSVLPDPIRVVWRKSHVLRPMPRFLHRQNVIIIRMQKTVSQSVKRLIFYDLIRGEGFSPLARKFKSKRGVLGFFVTSTIDGSPGPPTSSHVFEKARICSDSYRYRSFCSDDISHLIKYSTLSGNCDSTSFFSLLNKNGLNTLCNRRIIKIVSSSFNSTFSPVVANGALNHCSNVVTDLKILGNRKFSNAHNSGNLFCSGVPVNSRRCGDV